MSTEVISVRIPKELKEEIERLNINTKEIIEKALRESVEAKKKELVRKLLYELRNELSKISEDEWIKAIKEARGAR